MRKVFLLFFRSLMLVGTVAGPAVAADAAMKAGHRAGERAAERRTGINPRGYSERELRLLIPASDGAIAWEGITFGLGPDPAGGNVTGQFPQMGIEAQARAYDVQTDELTLRVTQTDERRHFRLVREARLKPWEPFTFSNGSCAGYLFWHRQKNVRPAGYADLQFRGFCP